MRRVLVVGGLAGIAVAVSLGAQRADPADLILTNAKIVTMDAGRPRAAALAIRGERIAAVGTTAEVLKLKGDGTKVIDIGGKTIVPGLVDGHLHFAGLAERGQSIDLSEARSETDAAALVRRAAERMKPGEWITGSDWHTGNWGREVWPSKQTLDEAAPANPVLLAGMHGHASWANTKALDAAGVDDRTADPPGGKILRDDAGKATGIFIENAQALVRDKIPARPGSSLRDRVRKSIDLALSYGFTGAHDMGTTLETVDAYKALIVAGDFPFRITAYPRVVNAGPLLDKILAAGRHVDPGHRLIVRGVKVSIDGALGSRGAALMAPYDDEPANIGVIRVPYDQLYFIVERSLRAGFTAAIHAIGDRGNQMALDAVEQAVARVPTKDHRIRIEHAQVLRPEDVPRFAKLNLLASMQWMHCTLDMPWAEKRVGPARIKTSYAWRSLMNAGVRLVGGSDEGARTFSPFMGIHAAVTRQDAKGWPDGGWYPAQRLTREEALRSYTIDAAFASFQENDLGSLTPGKLADLAVLSKDVMTIPAAEILTTEAVMTIVGGRIAFERGGARQTSAAAGATYARPELLADTAWLAAHLQDPAVRIVDLRPRGYEDGHIPGSVHLPNAATRDPGQAPAFVPPPGDFEQSMANAGITNATRVVAYDDRGGVYAARLWWLLNYYGHSNVALLDGGWTKWTLEGRPVDRAPAFQAGRGAGGFVARPQRRWLATASDVVSAIGKPGVKIVDARTTGEIEGRELRGARRGGIVPSAIPVYWEDALNPDTRAFKAAPALARLYRDRGVLPEHDVIAYCQVGMRASHDLFVLHLLGYDKLKTYLGSWDEWGNRDDLPIAAANTAKAFVGARVINGRGTPPLDNATLIVETGRLTAVGPAASTRVPTGAERIDVTGRTIVPGFINAHGHVGDTRGLKSAAEFYTEENLRAQLGLYARYGVTTVASLGGDRETAFALRDAQRTASFDLARLLVAGPVIGATTAEEARAEVDRVAATKPDIIKIRVDDNLGTTQKMPIAAAIAVVEQAHKHGLRAAAHIFYLDDAKALARAGVDMLAHSVRDKPVDDELIGLLKGRDACVCPTLMREVSTFVYGSTPDFFSDPFFLRSADPKILDELRDPKRQETVRASRGAQAYLKALDVASANLKRLADGGVRIAFGTDTGPPARFQGFFEHEELKLMVEKAGLTPMQTIRAATSDAAACLQAKGIGVLEPGAWADFIVLEKNPAESIGNTRSIESVWIAGRRIAR